MNQARIIRLQDGSAVAFREAARSISEGGLVAYPTDTVYGLGCDPFNTKALEKLIRVKKRQKGALPVLADSLDTARVAGIFEELADRIAEVFWPGPLTIVVPVKKDFPPQIAPAGMVGLRVPDNVDTLALIRECGGLIVGTSANISGYQSCRSGQEVVTQLGASVDLVLDDGPAKIGIASTVLQVLDGRVRVIRDAAVSRERILSRCPFLVFD